MGKKNLNYYYYFSWHDILPNYPQKPPKIS
jgi:hypothetical protein